MSVDMFPDAAIDYMLKMHEENNMDETCKNCGNPVKVAIFKGTGHCSENCRKDLAGEDAKPKAQTDAGITNILTQAKGVDPRGIS